MYAHVYVCTRRTRIMSGFALLARDAPSKGQSFVQAVRRHPPDHVPRQFVAIGALRGQGDLGPKAVGACVPWRAPSQAPRLSAAANRQERSVEATLRVLPAVSGLQDRSSRQTKPNS